MTTFDRLDVDVEQRLIDDAQAGDERAIEALITQYDGAIRNGARRSRLDVDDAMQEARFAFWEIVMGTTDLTPQRLAGLVRKAISSRIYRAEVTDIGMKVSPSTMDRVIALSREADGDHDEAHRLIDTGGHKISHATYNTIVGARSAHVDVTELDVADTPVIDTDAVEARTTVEHYLKVADLTHHESVVITSMYGLDGCDVQDMSQIAEQVGVSIRTVIALKQRALNKIVAVARPVDDRRDVEVYAQDDATTQCESESTTNASASAATSDEDNASAATNDDNDDATTNDTNEPRAAQPLERLAVRGGDDSRTGWAPTGVGRIGSLAGQCVSARPGTRLASSVGQTRHSRVGRPIRDDAAVSRHRNASAPHARHGGAHTRRHDVSTPRCAYPCSPTHRYARARQRLRATYVETTQNPRRPGCARPLACVIVTGVCAAVFVKRFATIVMRS